METIRALVEGFLRGRYGLAPLAAVASLLIALSVTSAGFMQTPTYEASAHVWVGEASPAQETGSGKVQLIPNAPTPERLEKISQQAEGAIDSRPVAEEAIRRLRLVMSPSELLDNLTARQVENTGFIVLTYEDTDPVRAKAVVGTVAEVSSERISERSAGPPEGQLTANVYEKAAVPTTPVSPNPFRNELITLVMGLVLCAGMVVARPGVGAGAARTLGKRPSCQGIGQASLGVLGRRHSDDSIIERVKEKELLLALGRRGKLTAVEAALETSLSVEEANRMLFELAAKGHLEVTLEGGRLLYSFWDRRA